jgi:hypothetical protein
LEEFLLKTLTSPFKVLGNLFGSNPESIKQIPFDYLQDSLSSVQRNNLDKIADIIIKKPDLAFNLVQTTDPQLEKALIAKRNAKILYSKTIVSDTSISQIIKTASEVKDNSPEFYAYLGIQENATADDFLKACYLKSGDENIMLQFNQLNELRKNLLTDYLNKKNLPQGSVLIKTADLRNLPDELKKPQFIVDLTLK